jgi:hypothetical protein
VVNDNLYFLGFSLGTLADDYKDAMVLSVVSGYKLKREKVIAKRGKSTHSSNENGHLFV